MSVIRVIAIESAGENTSAVMLLVSRFFDGEIEETVTVVDEESDADWEWPEWIKPGIWIAMDATGYWYAYENEPQKGAAEWIGVGELIHLSRNEFVNFTPPPCTDWLTSKMQKPV